MLLLRGICLPPWGGAVPSAAATMAACLDAEGEQVAYRAAAQRRPCRTRKHQIKDRAHPRHEDTALLSSRSRVAVKMEGGLLKGPFAHQTSKLRATTVVLGYRRAATPRISWFSALRTHRQMERPAKQSVACWLPVCGSALVFVRNRTLELPATRTDAGSSSADLGCGNDSISSLGLMTSPRCRWHRACTLFVPPRN